MATKNENVPVMEQPRVLITLPVMPMSDDGVKRDPYEHVTINGKTTMVKRGVPVEVTPEVFIQLRNKYPTI